MNRKTKAYAQPGFALLIALVMTSVFCGCMPSIDDRQENLVVYLPDFNVLSSDFEGFPTLSRWYVKIVGEAYSDCFFVSGSEFHITVRKNQLLGITAYPLINEKNSGDDVSVEDFEKEVSFFCCAGAILPYCCPDFGTEIQMDWYDGFCAALMQRIFSGAYGNLEDAGRFAAKFNWKKLRDLLREKMDLNGTGSEIFYNPWLLDADAIVQRIAGGNFTASTLSLKYVFSVDCLNSGLVGENECLFSAFIPENEFIRTNGRVSLKKDCWNLFMTENSKGLLVKGNKEKNLSAMRVYMPIFCKGL